VSTAIIARGYATPILQPGKHIFYLVTLAILFFCRNIPDSWHFSEKECRECNPDFSKGYVTTNS
jgi:hypothetical protein